jgi:head-tail adaptor
VDRSRDFIGEEVTDWQQVEGLYPRFLASTVSTRHRFASGDQFNLKHRIWVAGGNDQHWEAELLLKMTQWRRIDVFGWLDDVKWRRESV